MLIRFAEEKDLDQINELRKQVNVLHTAAEPEIFKPGFPAELRDCVHTILNDPEKKIVAAESNGAICGFAILHHIHKPETPYMFVREYLDIDEFCVDQSYRRQGIGSELIRYIRAYAKETGFHRIELNMWEFNQDALAFYESSGFETYRRYMEMTV